MRQIDLNDIQNAVYSLVKDACYNIDEKVLSCIKEKELLEINPLGKIVLKKIIENDLIARNNNEPMCQDTGVTVVFLEIGNDVHFDGDIYEAINKGVSKAYIDGYLRKSVVRHPLDRVNTKDNTPAIIHTKLVVGDKLTFSLPPPLGAMVILTLSPTTSLV